MPHFHTTTGDRIRDLRLKQRLSQAQLAGPELSDSYIALIESGKRTITAGVAALLADRLGCSLLHLVTGLGEARTTDPERRAQELDYAEALIAASRVLARTGRPLAISHEIAEDEMRVDEHTGDTECADVLTIRVLKSRISSQGVDGRAAD